MGSFRKLLGWIAATLLGSALFAFGFSCFLMPNEISTGGISGLALRMRANEQCNRMVSER